VAATTLEQLMTLSILVLGAWLVMEGKGFTIGMLVAFQMFAGRLSQPMLRIAGLWQEFQQAAIAVKRLGDIMDAPAEPYALTPSRETKPEGRIEIEGLSFRYGPNLPYLYQDLSLEVEPGSCVAILGPSGCGKSTLAKLLQGFYWPEAGSIRIDGHDIRHLSANELRGHFGVVPQEATLFSGTIYENLILASPHATFEQVVQACKMAEIHGVIQALPEGYQTRIGEHGAGLSGRPETAHCDRKSAAKAPQDPHFRRGDVKPRSGDCGAIFRIHQSPEGQRHDTVPRTSGVERVIAGRHCAARGCSKRATRRSPCRSPTLSCRGSRSQA
jgi:subfamily B ATP-binding cassette protein HlyB/CyaB